MSDTAFGIPAFYRLIMETKTAPAKAREIDTDPAELTGETARAYVLTMLAVGAGNSPSGIWGIPS